jgi:dolichol-phosphate mannosyltransferase
MIRHSVIIPQRDRGDDLLRQLPSLTAALTKLEQPFEIIVVDDGSQSATRRLLDKLVLDSSSMRVVQLDRPHGASVALSAGIRAARGQAIIAMAPGTAYSASQLGWLLVWLERGDLVVGRRRSSGIQKLYERIARVPRWLLLGLESHDPDCLFWAARREAVADIALSPGMARYLPALVARRGFRVCEAYVEHTGPRRRLQDVRPNPGDLLAAWWHCRRWREPDVQELATANSSAALRLLASETYTPPSAPGANSYQAKSA